MDKAFWEDLTLEFSTAGKDIPGLWAHVCSEAKKRQWLHDSTVVQMLNMSKKVTSRFCFRSQYRAGEITLLQLLYAHKGFLCLWRSRRGHNLPSPLLEKSETVCFLQDSTIAFHEN